MSEKRRERMSQGRYCQSYYCNVIYFLIKKESATSKRKGIINANNNCYSRSWNVDNLCFTYFKQYSSVKRGTVQLHKSNHVYLEFTFYFFIFT